MAQSSGTASEIVSDPNATQLRLDRLETALKASHKKYKEVGKKLEEARGRIAQLEAENASIIKNAEKSPARSDKETKPPTGTADVTVSTLQAELRDERDVSTRLMQRVQELNDSLLSHQLQAGKRGPLEQIQKCDNETQAYGASPPLTTSSATQADPPPLSIVRCQSEDHSGCASVVSVSTGVSEVGREHKEDEGSPVEKDVVHRPCGVNAESLDGERRTKEIEFVKQSVSPVTDAGVQSEQTTVVAQRRVSLATSRSDPILFVYSEDESQVEAVVTSGVVTDEVGVQSESYLTPLDEAIRISGVGVQCERDTGEMSVQCECAELVEMGVQSDCDIAASPETVESILHDERLRVADIWRRQLDMMMAKASEVEAHQAKLAQAEGDDVQGHLADESEVKLNRKKFKGMGTLCCQSVRQLIEAISGDDVCTGTAVDGLIGNELISMLSSLLEHHCTGVEELMRLSNQRKKLRGLLATATERIKSQQAEISTLNDTLTHVETNKRARESISDPVEISHHYGAEVERVLGSCEAAIVLLTVEVKTEGSTEIWTCVAVESKMVEEKPGSQDSLRTGSKTPQQVVLLWCPLSSLPAHVAAKCETHTAWKGRLKPLQKAFEAQLNEMQEKIEKEKLKASELTTTFMQHKQRASEAVEQGVEREEILTKTEAEVKKLWGKIQTLKSECNSAAEGKRAAEGLVTDLEERVSTLIASVSEIEGVLAAERLRERQRVAVLTQQYETEITSLKGEIDTQKGALEALTLEVKDLHAQLIARTSSPPSHAEGHHDHQALPVQVGDENSTNRGGRDYNWSQPEATPLHQSNGDHNTPTSTIDATGQDRGANGGGGRSSGSPPGLPLGLFPHLKEAQSGLGTSSSLDGAGSCGYGESGDGQRGGEGPTSLAAFSSHMTVGMWDDVRQLREKLRLYDFEMAEVNSENERLLELVNVLKQELRRSEVATEMSELGGHEKPMMYLRNVMVKFMETEATGSSEHEALVPVLCTLLSLSKEEVAQVNKKRGVTPPTPPSDSHISGVRSTLSSLFSVVGNRG
eukprot:GHVN01000648.1.p1 GENE.GHVN01000648.1~~GHVN01000648.1.p1  ORF type:complete len:1040 (+),score=262.63 GHVN01000648.1:5895-9014(+)